VAGLLSLAIKVGKILEKYIGDVKSAPREVCDLRTEVSALCHVLKTLEMSLKSGEMARSFFDEKSSLLALLKASERHIEDVNQKLKKLQSDSKISEIAVRIVWPFHKDECREITVALNRYAQTLSFLLTASNR
jgi:hypothetical protein